MTKTEDPIALAEERARRLQLIVDGYEVGDEGMPDATVPGAACVVYLITKPEIPRKHPRYVLVTQYGDKGNYRLYLADDRPNVERLAAAAVTDDELVYCYYDLDELAGEAPTPDEGDQVRLNADGVAYGSVEDGKRNSDVVFHVVGTETDTFDGRAFEWLYLSTNPEANYLAGEYDAKVDEAHVEVVEPAYPDERMPVRYGLAKVVVSVAFNTVPSP